MSTTEEMSGTASEVKNTAASQGHELAATAKGEVGAFAGEVKEQASSVIRDVRDQVEQQADAQARRLGSGMQDARRQLASVAERGDGSVVSSLAGQLADSLGSVGDRIDEGGVAALADDVRSFARRQPGLFLLGAGAVGFVAARLLRHAGTGAPNHASSQQSSSGSGPGNGSLGAPVPGIGLPAAETGPLGERGTVSAL